MFRISNLVTAFARYRHGQALTLILMLGVVANPSMAQETSRQASDSGAGQDSLAELGAKLSNPLSDVWALFTEPRCQLEQGRSQRR